MTELLPVGPAVRELLPFIGFATDPASRKTLGMAAAASGWAAPDIREGGLEAALAHVARKPAPAFLVVDLTGCDAPLAQMDALADLCPEGTRVLAIGNHNDVHLFRGLRSIGVSDYLLKPLDTESVAASLSLAMADGLSGIEVAALRPDRADVIAILGARGGVGTTSIAISLAHLAAKALRVMLLDLDLQGGTVALDLEAPRAAALTGILESPDRLDDTLLDGAAAAHPLGFRILAAEEPLERQIAVRPESVQALLSRLSGTHELVLVDLPRWLDRTVRTVLRTADRVVIVTCPTLAGLRDTRRLLALVSGLRAGQAPLVVLNRVGASKAEMAPEDFEGALGSAVALTIPEAAAVAAKAAGSATALSAAAAGRTPARQLARLVDMVVPTPAVAAMPLARRAGWPAWLPRLGKVA
jgi:pilus assembly protein CpaE